MQFREKIREIQCETRQIMRDSQRESTDFQSVYWRRSSPRRYVSAETISEHTEPTSSHEMENIPPSCVRACTTWERRAHWILFGTVVALQAANLWYLHHIHNTVRDI